MDAELAVPRVTNRQDMLTTLHDTLRSYTDVRTQQFVGEVVGQVTMHMLVDGKDSPLRIFSPPRVLVLSPEQLEEVAGEDAKNKIKRNEIEQEIADLEEAQAILEGS